MNKNLAVITGASSGIGFEIAKELSKQNVDILLVARNIDNLKSTKSEIEKTSKNKIEILSLDLSKENFIQELDTFIGNRTIKYLINNAGFGDFGNFIDCNLEKQINMVNLNIKSVMVLSKYFLEKNRETTNNCYLLNVASVAGFMPGPLMSVYYATKAFVLSFSESLYYENRNKCIKISILCPGATETNFIKSSNLEKSGLFKTMKTMKPSEVAKISIKNLYKGKMIIIPGIINKLSIFLLRFSPRKLVLNVVEKIMRSK